MSCGACDRMAANRYAKPLGSEHDNDCPVANKDARGVPITVGSQVVYGAGVGRSVAMVVGRVTGWTPSGRAWVDVEYRAFGGYGDRKSVHVDPTRMVVVKELP